MDIRTVGSGNIGATNAFRVLGKPAGIFVLVADGLKGYAACIWMMDPLLRAFGVPLDHAITERVAAGICAVLGHNFTCWLRFKGGKGIATTAGVYLAVALPAALIAVGVWVAAFVLTRYVSIASLLAAVVLPTAVWLAEPSIPLGLVTTALGVLAIWKHKANIVRLKAGTENRIQFGKKSNEGGKA
jgi:glycerol-3-phosphate acyltransferase PlsY